MPRRWGAVLPLLAVAASANITWPITDLYCTCHAAHRTDRNIAVHCQAGKGNNTGFTCDKAAVVEILPGYQYILGYALVKLFRTYRTWHDAKRMCEADGGSLAVPPDKPAINGLKQMFSSLPGVWYAYTGINDEASEGRYVGPDGKLAPYLPWQDKEPNNLYNDENCVSLTIAGLMNDDNCALQSAFFCERRLSVVVPDLYRWFADAGRFYRVHDDQQSRPQAVLTCSSENATLAVPDTWRRVEAILRLLDQPKVKQQYFVGLTDEAVEGDFVSETGRHHRDMEFQEWGEGEPNNDYWGKPENCLVLTNRGHLNDYSCDSPLPFVCEIAPA